MIAADPDGKEAEVGVIGREGMVNAGVVAGMQRSPMRLLVQIAGAALRVSERVIVAAAADRPSVARLLVAYNQVLAAQAAFAALAYAQYTLPQRLARWALMCGTGLATPTSTSPMTRFQ